MFLEVGCWKTYTAVIRILDWTACKTSERSTVAMWNFGTTIPALDTAKAVQAAPDQVPCLQLNSKAVKVETPKDSTMTQV